MENGLRQAPIRGTKDEIDFYPFVKLYVPDSSGWEPHLASDENNADQCRHTSLEHIDGELNQLSGVHNFSLAREFARIDLRHIHGSGDQLGQTATLLINDRDPFASSGRQRRLIDVRRPAPMALPTLVLARNRRLLVPQTETLTIKGRYGYYA